MVWSIQCSSIDCRRERRLPHTLNHESESLDATTIDQAMHSLGSFVWGRGLDSQLDLSTQRSSVDCSSVLECAISSMMANPRLSHTPNRLSWSLDVITINRVCHWESCQMIAGIFGLLRTDSTWLVCHLQSSTDACDHIDDG